MFDRFIIALHERKLDILKSGIGTCNPEIEKSLYDVFEKGAVGPFAGCFNAIAEENIRAALFFKERISMALHDGYTDVCLFVHGSTGRGLGQIAPNVDYDLSQPPTEPRMLTRVIPGCRDDLDLILVVRDPAILIQEARKAAKEISGRGIEITVNVVSWDNILNDLKSPDTPAIRRILLFNHPKPIIGTDLLQTLTVAAEENQTWLDVPHETDFRLLMQLAELLVANNKSAREFSASELLLLFPTFYLTCTTNIHIGFPLGRIKIKENGASQGRQKMT